MQKQKIIPQSPFTKWDSIKTSFVKRGWGIFHIFIFKICIFFLIYSFNQLYSQGFDWQYSSRMPSAFPYLYLGIGAGLNSNMNISSINNIDNCVICGSFTGGTGSSQIFSFSAEYWISGLTALIANINYNQNNLTMESQPYTVPTQTHNMISVYRLESEFSYLALDLGAKTRLFDTHLFVGGSLSFGLLTNHNFSLYEKYISDDYFPSDSSKEM